MELSQLLKQKTNTTLSEIESAMKEGGYSERDLIATYVEGTGFSAETLIGHPHPTNKTLTVKHKITGIERSFDLSGNPSWDEQLKQDLKNQLFGH